QLLRIFHRQRPEQDRVDNREDGGVRPDAEREREHGHGGEAGVLEQLAEGEFQIVHCSLSVVGCQWSVVPCRSQAKFPKPKTQAPEKSQAANRKRRLDTAILELGIWSVFG